MFSKIISLLVELEELKDEDVMTKMELKCFELLEEIKESMLKEVS